MSKKRKNLGRSLSLLAVILLVFTACKKTELYHNLNEEEANEILVVLHESNIKADKDKEIVQNEIYWKITLPPKDLARARSLLVERNLPRKRELGLSGVYKEKGLIPTPDEQKARFLLAIKGEIVNSLERIPEVIDADVVINIPTPEEFSTGEEQRPTASVVLKMRPTNEAVTQITESKVQQFVANSVEKLNPRDVSVIISYVTMPPPELRPGEKVILPEPTPQEQAASAAAPAAPTVKVAGVAVAAASALRLKIYLALFLLLLILLAATLVINIFRTNRMRHEFRALTSGPGRPLLEGEVESPARSAKERETSDENREN